MLRGPAPRGCGQTVHPERGPSPPEGDGAVWPRGWGQPALLSPCPQATCAGEAAAPRPGPGQPSTSWFQVAFLEASAGARTKLNFGRKESNKGLAHTPGAESRTCRGRSVRSGRGGEGPGPELASLPSPTRPPSPSVPVSPRPAAQAAPPLLFPSTARFLRRPLTEEPEEPGGTSEILSLFIPAVLKATAPRNPPPHNALQNGTHFGT